MTCRKPRARSGVTLTEILISILILGVGMVSLATLFPIGLLRLRDAQRNNRSVLLARYAIGEVEGRDLFNHSWFLQLYNPNGSGFDPWVFDSGAAGNVLVAPAANQLEAPRPGLPVAYDPLWYAQNGLNPATTLARFGAQDPADPLRTGSGDGGTVSAFGLQRISGFATLADPSIFVSPDDYVFQPENGATIGGTANLLTGASPLAPALDSSNNTVHDFSYSWSFTGYRAEAGEFSRYVGSIVIHNNRPFGLVGANNISTGERVVEGIFGYGGNRRQVMIRWNAGQPDPPVAVGGWIADVTYEQNAANSASKSSSGGGAMQRCNWYRVAKRGAAAPDPNAAGFMQMLVTVATPVTAVTPQTGSNPPVPTITNVALVMPSVVNVFPWSFFTRN